MIIVRYTEIGLKGKNRGDFEKALQKNVKHCLKKNNVAFEKVMRKRGRIIVFTDKECPQLNHVFGISSFSYATDYDQNLEVIQKAALKYYDKGSFRVSCQRSQKVLMPSPELAAEVGAYIIEKTGAKVDLHNPDTIVYVELMNNRAYLYSEKIPGPGGLPVGVEGRVVVLLQNRDSIGAAKLVMKRGCFIDVVKESGVVWKELHDYEYGFTIRELDEVPEDTDAVVVSDKLDSIEKYPYFVLRPLI